jgi:hypothetical protein
MCDNGFPHVRSQYIWQFSQSIRHSTDRPPIHSEVSQVGAQLFSSIFSAASWIVVTMIYTAEPETEDAERLSLAIVLGTQALID